MAHYSPQRGAGGPQELLQRGGDYGSVRRLQHVSVRCCEEAFFGVCWVSCFRDLMEASGAPADVLLQRPWRPVSISGCQLLAKSWFGETAYHILLTDMHCVWEERMDSAAIQERAQELNRRLRAPVKAFFSHLCEVVQPCLCGGDSRPDDEVQISLSRRDGDVSVKLKSELAGLPFYWEFHCTPAPVTVVCAQLVRPLLAMSHLLQRQVEQLGGLLVRKDAEIQDYQENGATLSRERLQTDVFVEQTYRQDFMAKALPLLCPEQQDALGFDSDLQRLYGAVVGRGNKRSQKRRLSEDDEEPDITSSLGESVGAEAGEDAEQNGKVDEPETRKADTPAARQSQPVTSKPAERPSSKPKKKKVGLFR